MEQLEFERSIELLKKYDIGFVKFCIIKDEKSFDKIDYPIVLKVFSKEIVHKSDVGGVIAGIKNKKEVIDAYRKLRKISRHVLMQEMIYGKEIIIGMKRDSQFGPVIMFGLGGTLVEIIKDISFRICPVAKKDAIEMIKEIKSYKILEGVRGDAGVDINCLADLIVKISKLSLKEDIKEVDLNPVIADEKKAVVVDARFMI